MGNGNVATGATVVRERMDTDGTMDRTGETGGNTRLAVIGESPRTGLFFLQRKTSSETGVYV